MIRPYLRDLINDPKLQEELNDEANDSEANDSANDSEANDSEANDGDTERGEWKLQLAMKNNCISTKGFEETRTIYSASKPVKFLWVVTQKMSLIDLLIHFYKDFNKQQKHQMIEEANLPMKVLFYCIISFRK